MPLPSLPTLIQIAARLGTEAGVRFVGDLAGGVFAVEPVDPSDWLRIAELVSRYRDLPLGTVDASVIATAERLDIRQVATVDRRHFSVVRPRHNPRVRAPPVKRASGRKAEEP